jgi:hypothetical protein
MRDSAFLFMLLAVFSGLYCFLSAFISSKKKAKEFFPDQALASKRAFFCSLNLAIVLRSAVLLLFLSRNISR